VYSVGMANATKKAPRSKPAKPSAATSRKSAKPHATRNQVQVISSKVVHSAPVFQVTSDEVIEPSGVQVRRDIIRHPGSVVVLALDESKKMPSVLLIRQYRYAADQDLWELPAGRIDPGEDALTGAKRELAEETGYSRASGSSRSITTRVPAFSMKPCRSSPHAISVKARLRQKRTSSSPASSFLLTRPCNG